MLDPLADIELIAKHGDSGSFFDIATSVLNAVLKIALLVGVGIRLEKQGMLNGPKRKCLSALAMDVCLPSLMFHDVLPEANQRLIYEGWQLMLWPLCYTTVGATIGVLCCIAVGIPSHHLGSAAVCAAFPNVNGFPVSIVNALGKTLPHSPNGFSAMVFLSLIQLTDGVLKYTVGPIVFRRDRRAVMAAHAEEHGKTRSNSEDFPLGASLRSIAAEAAEAIALEAAAEEDVSLHKQDSMKPTNPVDQTDDLTRKVTDFGLTVDQCRCVEPEWCRAESYTLFFRRRDKTRNSLGGNKLGEPLLPSTEDLRKLAEDVGSASKKWFKGAGVLLRELFPPQVTAVMLAIAIGIGPHWIKELLVSKDPRVPAPLGWVYGFAAQLGGGFVPLQMISLGGRLVNVASAGGPLAAKGPAGPRGRKRLMRIAVAVAISRMLLAPLVLFGIALAANKYWLDTSRPLAFWAPALIVSAMPTANNMSTMADLVGAGRSISASTTAVQLVSSPFVLAVSLTLLLAGAQYHLASDFARP